MKQCKRLIKPILLVFLCMMFFQSSWFSIRLPCFATNTSTTSVVTTISEDTTDETSTTEDSAETSETATVSSNSLSSSTGNTTLYYSDEALRRLVYIKNHPVIAACNLFTSLSQRIHETISNSKGLSLFFSLDGLLEVIFSNTIFQYVMVILSGILIVSIFKLTIDFSLNKLRIKDIIVTRLVIVVPLVMIMILNQLITLLSALFLNRSDTLVTANQVNPVSYDVVSYVSNSNSTITDEMIAKTIFRESFTESTSSTSATTVTEASTEETLGEETTITEATTSNENDSESSETTTESTTITNSNSNETSYKIKSTISSAQDGNILITLNSKSEIITELFESIKVADDSFVYYSSESFVPVHYSKYNESVFYYFYDWLTYQYYSYWANNREQGISIGDYTSQLKLPTSKEESNEFISTLTETRKGLTYNSTNGLNLMYKDKDYCYNGDYLKDLFGLSALFDMTDANGEALSFQELLDVSSKWEEDTKDYDSYVQTLGEKYNPMGQLIKSSCWETYQKNSSLRARNGLYPYSPSYLQEYYADDEVTTRSLTRLYGAYGSLGDTSTSSIKSLTRLEHTLNSLTETMYNDIKDCCANLTGSVSDESMIFCLALVCTYDFNTEFSTLSSKASSTSLDHDSVTIDTLLKSMFRTNTEAGSAALGESDEFYFRLLDSSTAGIVLVVIMSYWEIFLFLCVAARVLVLAFIVIISLSLLLRVYKDKKSVFGLLVQFSIMVVLHGVFMLELIWMLDTLPSKHLAVASDFITVLLLMTGSTLILILCFAVQFNMLIMLIKDPLNFGGQLFLDKVSSKIQEFQGSRRENKEKAKGDVVDESEDSDSKGDKEESTDKNFILEVLNSSESSKEEDKKD